MTFEAPAQIVDTIVLANVDIGYRLARWHFGNEREVESVIYEAALRAVRRGPLPSATTARASLLRIVSKVCDEWRRRRPTHGIEWLRDELDDCALEDMSAEHLLSHTADVPSIEEAIRSLPPRLREVLVLCELERLSYREAAHVMDMPVDSVMACLSQSRQALSRALERNPVAV